MTFYRVLRDLSKGSKIIPTGTITELAGLTDDSIERLIKASAISEVCPPPLDEIPGWTTRAAKLTTIGIFTATQFLAVTNYDQIKKLFRVKEDTVLDWQEQIKKTWLAPPPPKRRG